MRKFYYVFLPVILLILNCQQDYVMEIKKENGAITGQVLPTNSDATVEVRQGALLETTTVDKDGYFYFDDLKIGSYSINAYSNLYGSKTFSGIKVEEGAVTDAGKIILDFSNSLVYYVDPRNQQTEVRTYSTIRIVFFELMDLNSVRNAFSIFPEVPYDLSFASSSSGYQYLYVDVSLNFETAYTLKIDTTAVSLAGNRLLAPFESTFTTDAFRIYDSTYLYSSIYDNRQIFLYYTGRLDQWQTTDNISIVPETELDILINSNHFDITPKTCWISDCDYELTIGKGVISENSESTKRDTVITFKTKKLSVVSTEPYYDGKNFVPCSSDISFEFNYYLDESTILKALQVNPEFKYQIDTDRDGMQHVILDPDSLEPGTQYTISFSEDLTDMYGKHLPKKFSFSFVTEQ